MSSLLGLFALAKTTHAKSFTKLKALSTHAGRSYVRWGHTSCPITAELIYDGYVAGPFYENKGSGFNPLCLPKQPIFGRYADHAWGGILYGAEYELSHHILNLSTTRMLRVQCA